MIGFTKAPATYTGDPPSGSRVYLENAPEYLFSGSGTFFADGDVIYYAPLKEELHQFSTQGGPEVLAATPGLLRLMRLRRLEARGAVSLVLSPAGCIRRAAGFVPAAAGPCGLAAVAPVARDSAGGSGVVLVWQLRP